MQQFEAIILLTNAVASHAERPDVVAGLHAHDVQPVRSIRAESAADLHVALVTGLPCPNNTLQISRQVAGQDSRLTSACNRKQVNKITKLIFSGHCSRMMNTALELGR